MKITLTNDKKSIEVEIKETAVLVEMRAVGDTMVFTVEERPMMAIEEQPKKETCKWKMTSTMCVCINPHDGNYLNVKGLKLCPDCGKKIEVVQ